MTYYYGGVGQNSSQPSASRHHPHALPMHMPMPYVQLAHTNAHGFGIHGQWVHNGHHQYQQYQGLQVLHQGLHGGLHQSMQQQVLYQSYHGLQQGVLSGHQHQVLNGHQQQVLNGHQHQVLSGHQHQVLSGHQHQVLNGHQHQVLSGHQHQVLNGHQHQGAQGFGQVLLGPQQGAQVQQQEVQVLQGLQQRQQGPQVQCRQQFLQAQCRQQFLQAQCRQHPQVLGPQLQLGPQAQCRKQGLLQAFRLQLQQGPQAQGLQQGGQGPQAQGLQQEPQQQGVQQDPQTKSLQQGPQAQGLQQDPQQQGLQQGPQKQIVQQDPQQQGLQQGVQQDPQIQGLQQGIRSVQVAPEHEGQGDQGMDGGGEHLNGHHHMSYNQNAQPPAQQSEEATGIRDVWAHNLYAEFATIRELRHLYPYVAMDTEFPGVVARPIGTFRNPQEYQYQLLRANCNMLRLIQLGLTLLNGKGQTPHGITTWQFNFKFSIAEDMYANDSIELLQNSGIQFKKLETDGIDPFTFSELLITSGLVLNDQIKWISFHSGYDFGYLYRILMDRHLPESEKDFFDLLQLFFPYIYDIKYLMKSCKNLKGGLQEVADELMINRLGLQHQAGSDALVTGLTFFKMKEMFFEENIDDMKYNGHVYGLSASYAQYNEAASQQAPAQPQSEHSATNF